MVVAFRILVGQIVGEEIVTGRSKAVAAYAAVVLVLILGLPERSQTDDDVACSYSGIVNDLAAADPGTDGAVNDDGPHQVPHIGRLSAGEGHPDAVFLHRADELVGTGDDSRYDFSGNQILVPAYGRRNQHAAGDAHAEQVIGVHDHGVPGNAFPYTDVPCLPPVGIGQG